MPESICITLQRYRTAAYFNKNTRHIHGQQLLCMTVCVCVCAYIFVFAHNLNQYAQEGGIKASNRLQTAEASSGRRAPNVLSAPQSFQSVQQTTLSTFVSPLPQDMIPLLSLPTEDHQSVASPCCPTFIIFRVFFFLPIRAFKSDLCSPGKRTAAGNKDHQPITDFSEWSRLCVPHS